MRVFIPSDPFMPQNTALPWRQRGLWPAWWVDCPAAGAPPFVSAYRLQFVLPPGWPPSALVHVSADERYELFLDGTRLGRGPERGDPDHWFYESYALGLAPGEHLLSAIVCSLGERAAHAQMSVHPGFILAAEGDYLPLLSTGLADWQASKLERVTFLDQSPAVWRGARFRLAAPLRITLREHDGGALLDGQAWQPARRVKPGLGRLIDWDYLDQHRLQPATLPPMIAIPRQVGTVRLVSSPPGLVSADLPPAQSQPDVKHFPLRQTDHLADETPAWQAFVLGQARTGGVSGLTLPPYTARRVIIDLGNYYTAYPELTVSGGAGALIRLSWAEAALTQPDPWAVADKGQRDEIEGKYFVGLADEFLPQGGGVEPAVKEQCFSPLWWQAGRYLELLAITADQPLTLRRLVLVETRYPLEMESVFECAGPDQPAGAAQGSAAQLTAIMPLLVRGMQMNAHEHYCDCPYYEELQYAGDTRLEILCTYVMTRDDRLPRKAMRLFDSSRRFQGFTQARYPCRVTQYIAPWSLWWVAMVHDYLYWRDDFSFVRALLPGVRATLEAFRGCLGEEGLLHAPEGWNVLDWAPEWDDQAGIPPGGIDGVSAPLNWQLILALTQAADLEAQVGEPELAQNYRRWAGRMAEKAVSSFWDAGRGLLADDLAHQHFSEHCQCLALLSGLLDAGRTERLRREMRQEQPGMARASFHFLHYLFEMYRLLEDPEAILDRLAWWDSAMVQQGLKTPLERFEPSRSDCHAWSSHPLFHYFATLLGIRPASPGFRTVSITPRLGRLGRASGRLVHPSGGEIVVDVRQEAGRLHGRVTLPIGVSGVLHANGQDWDIPGGYHPAGQPPQLDF